MPSDDGYTWPCTTVDTKTMPERGQSADDVRLVCDFLTSAGGLARCPRDAEPEVAFVGRSNAGKSSSLNRLTGRRNLARVSKTPGRTQLINFFAVASGGRLVDLPGYGYAKASKSRRQAWGKAVDDYLNKRANLAAVVLVIDARHPLQPFDNDMLEWCAARELPLLALLNKADKLSRSAQTQALRGIAAKIPACGQALLFSAANGQGSPEAVAFVRARLGA